MNVKRTLRQFYCKSDSKNGQLVCFAVSESIYSQLSFLARKVHNRVGIRFKRSVHVPYMKPIKHTRTP